MSLSEALQSRSKVICERLCTKSLNVQLCFILKCNLAHYIQLIKRNGRDALSPEHQQAVRKKRRQEHRRLCIKSIKVDRGRRSCRALPDHQLGRFEMTRDLKHRQSYGSSPPALCCLTHSTPPPCLHPPIGEPLPALLVIGVAWSVDQSRRTSWTNQVQSGGLLIGQLTPCICAACLLFCDLTVIQVFL